MADARPLRPPPPRLDDACALFLDVDGTLIPFAEHPERVQLLPQVRDAIGRLYARLGGAVALVSGRPLTQLDALFAPLRLPAAGLHGHELRADATARARISADTGACLHLLQTRAAPLAQTYPGVLVEDKGASLALHWRAAPAAAEQILTFAREQIATLPGYRLQPGDHVIEFVPEGSDKGVAVNTLLLQPPFHGRRPVFVGDDLTDEFGFAAANQAGGWSVLVGHRAYSAATYALPDPHGVHTWLRDNAV
ncbi:trehalose-phosphatase [Xanthomonas sp. MUS 060]|uniref:trehalose-phosphatase n=1 Tax=Xanthomonas sp. MUS 060 TaxID=1588031 RepID=UPI0005F2932C|nr:trehalose-phosphatase [Xanthomonas sp. MUS 060]